MKINFKKTEQAKRIETSYAMNAIDGASFTPIRKTSGAIGYDCFACIDQELAIFPGDVVKIGTGICLDMASSDTYIDLQIDVGDVSFGGFLFPRSSLAGLSLTNSVGVIDPDYQGEIIGKFFNYSEDVVYVKPLDRLLQLLFIPTYLPSLCEVDEFEKETERGSGGFGSSGK